MACVQSFPPANSKELRRILKLVDQANPIVANMLEMSALTGLRYCDCSILKKSDVMINGAIRDRVTITQQKAYNKRKSTGMSDAAAKKASKLTVSFNDQAKDIIKDACRLSPDSTYLFESDRKKGSPYSAQYVNRILKKVATKLQLNYSLSTHSFRKSFAQTVVKKGAPVHMVRDLLGHSSLSSTDHYLSTFMGDADKIVAKIKF